MVKVVELNLLKNLQQVEEISEQIIGMQLVTPQTSAGRRNSRGCLSR
jgi:hypothetical protein